MTPTPLLMSEDQQGKELELLKYVWRKKRLSFTGESCWSWAGLSREAVKGLEEQLHVGKEERVVQIHVTE